jgi:hypothetical protein
MVFIIEKLFIRTLIVNALREWCRRAFIEIVGTVKKADAAGGLHHGRSVVWRHLDLLETMA